MARTALFKTNGSIGSLIGLVLLSSVYSGGTAHSQALGDIAENPVLVSADELSFDQELGIVTARGGVEIAQGERILLADSLSFNQKTDVLTANGNIKILEPSGEVIFADYVELTDEMRNGIIEQIRVLLSDNARLAANGARREDGNRTILAKGVYSPCLVCQEDPNSDPLWQVKANRVIHDQQEQVIQYEDAFLEFWGVPVVYTPYFQHPDPTVERRTGFLVPDYGTNSNTGSFVRVPYFWAIDQDRDATIDPIYTTDDGLVYSGEYRQRFNSGQIKVTGSMAIADRTIGDQRVEEVKEDEFRGHVFAEARFDIDDTWRAGADIERSSDNTYLRRFDFFEGNSNVNETNVFIEGFNGRNYASANGYLFQDLRTGQRSDEPLVLPLLAYNGLGDLDNYGGRWSLDTSYRFLEQNDRADSHRVSASAGYEVPYTHDLGFVATTSVNLRMDAYYTNHNRSRDDFGQLVEDGYEGRFRPEIKFDLRYPLIRPDSSGDVIVEPIAAFLASPKGGNSSNISNDDSTVVEIDESNLFDVNRVPGLDRVEGGQRVVYGLRVARNFNTGGAVSAFIGQSQKLTSDEEFSRETGIESGRSDIVGRLDIRPTQYLDAFYRFRYDEDNNIGNRNELGFVLGSDALSLSGNYTFLRDGASINASQLDEASLAINAQWDDFWRVRAASTRDLSSGGGALEHSAGLIYEDECLIFDLNYRRTFTGTVDAEASEDVLLRLTFKTFTAVETGLF